MNVERFLESKLQLFSILDLSLVKSVYFVLSLLIYSFYPKLAALDWWFYFILSVLSAMPLWIHLFSQPGNLLDKLHHFIKTNGLPTQVLLFLSVFFTALMLGTLLPILVSFVWWQYLIIVVLLAIKPLTVTWFW